MAIYNYECTKCKKVFVVQKLMGQADPETCCDIENFQHDQSAELKDTISAIGSEKKTFCEYDAPVVRLMEKPAVNMRKSAAELDGKDLEYRIREHLEAAQEGVKKDKKSGIGIDFGELEDKFKK
jgi:hypothetical protein